MVHVTTNIVRKSHQQSKNKKKSLREYEEHIILYVATIKTLTSLSLSGLIIKEKTKANRTQILSFDIALKDHVSF